MFRTFLFLLLFSGIAMGVYAQDLRFDAEGSFKIVQFTDIHHKSGSVHSFYALDMINETLDVEKPDLVVFTGDVVVAAPTPQGWDDVLESVISRDIPYMVVFGNHDDENEWNREQVAEYVSKKQGLVNATPALEGVKGYMNGAVLIKNSKGEESFVLYTFDSHAYSTNSKIKGYGWFDISQINWYQRKSQEIKSRLKDTIPALAFFHIPLPEYTYAFNDIKNKRIGVRYEAECPPYINTGMYAAMLQEGDVLGTFVGHDHVNDYLVDYHGIALAYGCWSGSKNTYTRSQNGARVILLQEGIKGFETYIRQRDGSLIYQTSYPFSR